MSKHRKASGPKPGGKKQKTNGNKELKDKTVAAEIGAAVMREEAPKPPPAPGPRPVPAAAPAVTKDVATEKAPEPRPAAPKDRAKTPASAVAKVNVAEPLRLLDTTVDTFERAFKAVGQGTIAVNRKLLDFTRANVSSGFDFAMSLASASSPVQIMQLQMDYWDERMKALVSQAQELRALSADLVANTNEPIRQHLRAK